MNMAHENPGKCGIQRLHEIEGLRGYLAWWVVIGHIICASGYDHLPGALEIIRVGHYSVRIFIIISGFVIFYLFNKSQERYGPYILRRFFRLFPVFFCCLAAGALLLDFENQTLLMLKGLYPADFWQYYYQRNAEVMAHGAAHMITHLTMLHGAIPEQWLPSSSVAFLPPAWSVSLEWQFYLIAPLCFWMLRGGKRSTVLLIAAFLSVFWWRRYLPEIKNNAFLPCYAEYFCIGIISFYLFDEVRNKIPAKSASFAWLLSLLLMVSGISLRTKAMDAAIPLALWFLFFILFIAAYVKHSSPAARVCSALFNSRISQYLGKVSYCTYCVHAVVIIAVQYGLLQLFHFSSRAQLLTATACLTIPLTAAGAHLLHICIEQPAIRFGVFLKKAVFTGQKISVAKTCSDCHHNP